MWKLLALSTILVNLFLTVCVDIDPGTVSNGSRANDVGAVENINVVPIKCAINEKFDACPENRCLPQICDHVGIPQCTSHEEKYYHGKEEIYQSIGYNVKCGPPACVCIENHVRNNEGVCIPTTLCPSCGNDKNATSGCGINCGRRCSNYDKKPVKCAQECYVNSCDCKEGYVLDDFTGFCVLPKDCSNKNAPKPEGDDGSSEDDISNDSTENVSNADPCGKCDKENCDVQDMKDNKLDGGETCEVKEWSDKDGQDKNNKTTTKQPGSTKTTKPEKTTTTADPTSTTEELDTTTTEEPDSTTKKEESWLESIKNKFTPKTDEPCKKDKLSKLTTITDKTDTTSENSETTKNTTKTKHPKASTTPKSETSTKTSEGSSQTSTESTTKSSEDCEGKHELYACASSCPQLTCAEYLNGMKCHAKTKPKKKCQPECRCRLGYYRDWDENCVSAWDCKKLARPTTTKTTVSSTTTKKSRVRTTTAKPTTPEPNCEDEALELFIKGNLAYTVKILQELSLSRPESNVLCAGASILTLTSELALMATGNTKKQLLSAVNFSEREQIRCFFPTFIANYTGELRYIEYNSFSIIYADEQCQLYDDFKTTTKEIFSAPPENIDFNSPESAQQISETVAQNTNNIIENFISTETLSKLDKGLLLLDAQSFKGQLEKPFDPAYTRDRYFYASGQIVKKPTMKQKGIFMYTESLFGAKIVSLKYKKGKSSEDYKLVIVLPNSKHGLKYLMKKLENPDVWLSALDKMRPELVEIYLPRINITVGNKLKMPTEKAKIDLIFDHNSSGLKHIADCEKPTVNEILQRSVLEVNESGMEHQNGIDFESEEGEHQNKLRLPYLFKANHPFFYAIFSNRIILMAGIYGH